MKKGWMVASLLFLALAIFVFVESFDYPYIDRLGPGPGFFPFWLSLITGTLSLLLIIQTGRGKEKIDYARRLWPQAEGTKRIVTILGSLGACLFFLENLGFRLALFAFLLFLPLALGTRNWIAALIFSVIGSFGIFHIFYYWLKLPLPIGFLGV